MPMMGKQGNYISLSQSVGQLTTHFNRMYTQDTERLSLVVILSQAVISEEAGYEIKRERWQTVSVAQVFVMRMTCHMLPTDWDPQ